MSERIKAITQSRLHLNVLSPKDIRKIHQATLEVIETVGVRFPSEKALQIWEEHGARVDRKLKIVRVPGDMIEKAIRSAPPVYTLCARNETLDLPLDGNHVYAGTDGCGVAIIDRTSGLKRASCLKDVEEIARVADYLEEVAFHWVPVSAQDCAPESRGLHELLAIWKNSDKHVQTESIYSEREARAAVEMAAVLSGGKEGLRRRPILSVMECTVSPLSQDAGSLDAALSAADAGLPVGFMTMASCGSTGPASPAGNLIVGNAEVLSALALIQLAVPGAPVFYAAAQTVMDLRTGAYTGGGPEDFLFGAASNQLADFYNVPLSMGSFATGAKKPDWQAGVENSLSTFMASAAGADMLLGIGLLNGSMIWSFEQMLMDCEIFGIVGKMMEGISTDDESLALDAIRDVGPGGHFLAHPHTRKNARKLWLNTYFDRRPYSEWEKTKDGPHDWAREKAEKILAEHHPSPLDAKSECELQKIIKSIEKK